MPESTHGQTPAVDSPPPSYDSWELEEQLRHIERVLAPDKSRDSTPEPADQPRQIRLDAAHPETARRHLPVAKKRPKKRTADDSQSSSWHPVVTWTVLSLGLMAFACGGVLLGWSMVTGRDELWSIGMPITLGGQIALLIGLVLQLDRVWHDNQNTASKLDTVDRRLDELKTTTSLLGTTHSSAASSFYCHMAGGADPQLLLADLKSQLDMLAMKIGRVDR